MSESEKKEPKDWGEYERQGVPVLDLFLAAYANNDGDYDTETETEALCQIWQLHHPQKPVMDSRATFSITDGATKLVPGLTTSADGKPTGYGQKLEPIQVLVPACGHLSNVDVNAKVHQCSLPQGHTNAGIPHEDEGWKWYSADPKPFRKTL